MELPSVDLVALNPQPIPPGVQIKLVALNPQPLPPDATIAAPFRRARVARVRRGRGRRPST
jgi:hypothetical protein